MNITHKRGSKISFSCPLYPKSNFHIVSVCRPVLHNGDGGYQGHLGLHSDTPNAVLNPYLV